MKNFNSLFFLVLSLVLLGLSCCGYKPSHSESKEMQLNVGSLKEKEVRLLEKIRSGESHSLKVELEQDHFSEITVKPQNVDLSIEVLNQQNQPMLEANDLNGLFAEEQITILNKNTSKNTFTINIKSNADNKMSGSYEIYFTKSLVASNVERELCNADILYSEAKKINESAEQEGKELALKNCELALKTFVQFDKKRKQAFCLEQIGRLYRTSADYKKAIDFYRRALPIFHEIQLPEGEGVVLNAIGLAFYDQGEHKIAMEYYKKALPLIQKANNKRTTANLINNIGSILWSTGELESAVDSYNQVLDIYKEIDSQEGIGITFHNLGSVYDDMGDYNEATKFYNKALEVEKSINDILGESITRVMLGRSKNFLGKTSEAIKSYELAIKSAEIAGNKNVKSIALTELGNSYVRLKENEKAVKQYELAMPILKEVGNKKGEAINLVGQGKLFLEDKKYSVASNKLLEGLKIIQDITDISLELDALYGLAKLEQSQGNLKKGLEYIRKAVDLLESQRARLHTFKSRTAYFASVHDYYDLYIEILLQLRDKSPENDVLAFQMSEVAHARTLGESLIESTGVVRKNIDENLANQERENLELLDKKLQARLELTGSNKHLEVKKMDKEIESIKEKLKNLDREIRKQNATYISFKSVEKLNLKEIQNSLDTETKVVEYFLGNSNTYVWLISKNSFSVYLLPNTKEINQSVRKLYEAIAARAITVPFEEKVDRDIRIKKADENYPIISQELSNLILKPLNLNETKKLIIIPDGSLHYIPFNVLADPNARVFTPLVVNYEVSCLPSFTSLSILRTVQRPATLKTAIVISDPVFSINDPRLQGTKGKIGDEEIAHRRTIFDRATSGSEKLTKLPRLIHTLEESNSIKALVEPNLFSEKTGFAANSSVVKDDKNRNHRIWHFATHATVNSENPELSGLVLSLFDSQGGSTQGFISLSQIFSLKFPCELVFLSACDTGLGQEMKGEGLVGFTQGFMFAGAKRVITTKWSINDKASSELVSIFYQKLLKERKTYVASLREAQLEIMVKPRLSSPYYWASFVLQGEYL